MANPPFSSVISDWAPCSAGPEIDTVAPMTASLLFLSMTRPRTAPVVLDCAWAAGA
jgi:hypothetical protein